MDEQTSLFEPVEQVVKTAVLSGEDPPLYRYELTRHWDLGTAPVVWVMLNPSTADAEVDDPTIRRCIGFAKSWGYGGIVVANLFAYRATEPADLLRPVDPIGPENDYRLFSVAQQRFVVAAWGASVPHYWRHRPKAIARRLVEAGVALHHIGLTKDGQPRHPLFVRGDAVPTSWTVL